MSPENRILLTGSYSWKLPTECRKCAGTAFSWHLPRGNDWPRSGKAMMRSKVLMPWLRAR
ncbi:hypothetical protein D3C84_1252040 [compost metagenome]